MLASSAMPTLRKLDSFTYRGVEIVKETNSEGMYWIAWIGNDPVEYFTSVSAAVDWIDDLES